MVTESAKARRTEVILEIVLVALAFGGVALRWFGIDTFPGINGDELVAPAEIWDAIHGAPVDLSTPSGHIFSPLYTALNVPFVAFFASSVAAARAPAFVSALILLGGYALTARRVLDRTTFLIGGALLACLPWLIAMSRVSWEPALTPALIWFATYFGMRAAGIRAMLFLGLATINQVVAVFALPALVIIYLAAQSRQRLRVRLVITGAATALCAGFLYATVRLPSEPGATAIAGVVDRMTHPMEFVRFALNLGRLVSGIGIAEGFAGSPAFPYQPAVDIAVVILLAGLALRLAFVSGLRHEWRSAAFSAAWAISGVLFYLAAGPAMTEPGYERFPLFLAVPICVIAAQCLATFSGRTRVASLGLAVASTTALLASFYLGYLRPFETTGGSQKIYMTSALGEPKVAAVSIIQKMAGSQKTVIVADTWFTYWTVKYFLERDGNFKLYHQQRAGEGIYDRQFVDFPTAAPQLVASGYRLFGLSFPGASLVAQFDAAFPGKAITIPFATSDGRPAVQVTVLH